MKTSSELTDRQKEVLKRNSVMITPLIMASVTEANTYHIYRATGLEIKFTIEDKKLYCETHTLFQYEREYIIKNIIGNGKEN